MSEWQSMETAPKDGSWILAHCGPCLLTAFPVAWIRGRWFDGDVEAAPFEPTHWMPMPSAPDEGDRPPVMTTDFADREATSIIDLCRSLGHSPDLHGIVAAKLRVIWCEGKSAGIGAAITTLDGIFGTSTKPADEPPEWSEDGFKPGP